MSLRIWFQRIPKSVLPRIAFVLIASVLTGFVPAHAQAVTDFYDLPDSAFARGLVIDAYQTSQGEYRYAVASINGGRYIYILDSNFEQIAHLIPAQSTTITEASYELLDIEWSPDGRWLLATIDVVMGSYLQLWDMNKQQLITTEKGIFNGVTAWSPDNMYVALREESRILIIETVSGKVARELFMSGNPDASELAWDKNSELLAAINGQGLVNIWSMDSEAKILEINGANAEFAPVEIVQQGLSFYSLAAWSPHTANQIALYEANSSNIEIWDVAQKRMIASIPTEIVNLRWLYWTPIGLILYDIYTRNEPNSIQVWDPADGNVLFEKTLQQGEYIIDFLDLGDAETFKLVIGKAPLNNALSDLITVETIHIGE